MWLSPPTRESAGMSFSRSHSCDRSVAKSTPKNNNDTLRIGNWNLRETIGSGAFGKVKVGEHVSIKGIKVAVKIINKEKLKGNPSSHTRIQREISNMRYLNHPHIVHLYDVIDTKTHIFIVMEYVAGGELFDYIISHGKFSEQESRCIFQQIISAVSYCHNQKVVHRDLKPENLLLDSKTRAIKITDFGLSNFINDGELFNTACGSPNYTAPEVISGQQYSGPEVDIWSCGIILYSLLSARLPFDDSYIPHLFKKIREGKYTMPYFFSEQAKNLIGRILVVNPVERLTMEEIRNHEWFKENLPKYLELAAEVPTVKNFEINDRIVNEVAMRLKAHHAQIIDDITRSLESQWMGPYFVAYLLLSDQFPHSKEQGSTREIHLSKSLNEISVSPALNLRAEISFYEDNMDNVMNTMTREGSTPTDNNKKIWNLGLLSTHKPLDIMEQVFQVLQKHGFEWKVTGPYQLRCRHSSMVRDVKMEVKMRVQLFSMTPPNKKQNVIHLLDVKIIEGQMFQFLNLCGMLWDDLRHLELVVKTSM